MIVRRHDESDDAGRPGLRLSLCSEKRGYGIRVMRITDWPSREAAWYVRLMVGTRHLCWHWRAGARKGGAA